MGFAKDMMMRADDRGFWAIDGSVCAACVDDDALMAYINANAVEKACSYCHTTSDEPIAADADELLDHIAEGVKFAYDWVENELGSMDGEYIGDWHDMPDILEFELGAPLGEGKFAETVKAAATDQMWCRRDYYGTAPDEALRYDWDLFIETVKYGSRFMFLALDEAPDHERWIVGHPVRRGSAMLKGIADVIEHAGLVRSITGDELFRCRPSSGDTFATANELGSPPRDAARANRMSPAGIPMFYGAYDSDTAILETAQPGDPVVSVGKFGVEGLCTVVDLSSIPDIPSIFDAERRHLISPLKFLHGFAHDLVKPVDRDGSEHIEYVPTQIVTEYLRLIHRTDDDTGVDGLLYTSSRNGERCAVIFIDNNACIDADADADASPQLRLRLTGSEVRDLVWRPEPRPHT